MIQHETRREKPYNDNVLWYANTGAERSCLCVCVFCPPWKCYSMSTVVPNLVWNMLRWSDRWQGKGIWNASAAVPKCLQCPR